MKCSLLFSPNLCCSSRGKKGLVFIKVFKIAAALGNASNFFEPFTLLLKKQKTKHFFVYFHWGSSVTTRHYSPRFHSTWSRIISTETGQQQQQLFNWINLQMVFQGMSRRRSNTFPCCLINYSEYNILIITLSNRLKNMILWKSSKQNFNKPN